jgi:hypothetical protein
MNNHAPIFGFARLLEVNRGDFNSLVVQAGQANPSASTAD